MIETNHPIGMPAAALDPLAAVKIAPRHRVDTLRIEPKRGDLFFEILREDLIAIDSKDPIVSGVFRSLISQSAKPDKGRCKHLHVRKPLRNLERLIRRAVIEEDNFRKISSRCKRLLNRNSRIFYDHANRNHPSTIEKISTLIQWPTCATL